MISISPISKVHKNVKVVPSKSYAQRALALSGLLEGEVTLQNVGYNNDVMSAIAVLKAMGMNPTPNGNYLKINDDIWNTIRQPIHIQTGESGLSTRLFSCFSLLNNSTFTLEGEGSVKNRTMEMVMDGLHKFGKSVQSNDKKLPLIISGETKNNEIHIDGSISSQFLSGLLIVTPFLPFDTIIHVDNLKSVPYVEITLSVLQSFGISIHHSNFHTFRIQGNQRSHRDISYAIEGDWSAASYYIAAGAIGGRVRTEGLNQYSMQGDKAILEAVKNFGAKISWKDDELTIQKDQCNTFTFDATHCPDLFPTLAVLASYTSGLSIIKGVHRLYHKESNRALTIQQECNKTGAKVILKGDEMHIWGFGSNRLQKEITFHAHNDHRIAMAMSLFAIDNPFPIHIENDDAVKKSVPDFFDFYQ